MEREEIPVPIKKEILEKIKEGGRGCKKTRNPKIAKDLKQKQVRR